MKLKSPARASSKEEFHMQSEMKRIERENWDFSPRRLGEMAWRSEEDAPDGVPVLDLAILRGAKGTGEQRKGLAGLREAVTQSGFFYVKKHGISEKEIEAISNSARSFFGQPEEYKRAFDRHQQVRGYTGYRFESTARFFGT